MERGTPSDIRPDPRFLDIHANTPKVAFLKSSRWKNNLVGACILCPFRDRIVNSER